MSTSITEKILLNNTVYTDNYLSKIINLTKSISVISKNEGRTYNDYIELTYPTHVVDYNDKTSWRYYKHLSGQKHVLDQIVTLTSIDNGEIISLDRASIRLHRITREELLKFDLMYKELVDRFPEQELYIKAIIAKSQPMTIQQIIDCEDYTIISHNSDLIEENEDNLIQELQQRIFNYKNIFLIPYYANSDNLFLCSQMHILYTFIIKTILAIRLKNAKTLKAHSYHILNYLASHHYLDKYYNFLTKKQSLFLYRNLLYLDNHSGRHDIFKLLIQKLFTDRNMTVVNYVQSQSNSVDSNNRINYKFKQKLLNDANLVYSTKDFTLEDIKNKEYSLAQSNPKELTYNLDKIDLTFKNSLFSSLLTKDLETVIVDNTDTVKYKLIPTLLDYWAYLLKHNKIKFLVTVLDPVSNKELRLSTSDLFKLFTIILYKTNNQEIKEFQPYTIQRVYKPELPETNTLLKAFYRKYYWFKDTIDQIKISIPSYTNTITSFQFQQFVSSIYKLNIGLWSFLSNLDDKDTNGQFDLLIGRLHTSEVYTFNDTTPEAFLKDIGLENIYKYTPEALDSLMYSILNNLYDNRLDFLNYYKYVQKALIEVFKKFNSYTVQIIDVYESGSPILAGVKDRRVVVSEDKEFSSYFIPKPILNVETYYKIKDKDTLSFNTDVYSKFKYFSKINVSINSGANVKTKIFNKVVVNFNTKVLNSLGNSTPTVNQSSDEDLLFLALNS